MTLGPACWCLLLHLDRESIGCGGNGYSGWCSCIEDLTAGGYIEEDYFIACMAPTYAPLTVPVTTRRFPVSTNILTGKSATTQVRVTCPHAWTPVGCQASRLLFRVYECRRSHGDWEPSAAMASSSSGSA